MLACEHLADQPEREELNPDDDEKDAEHQERPAADSGALCLDDRQIEKDRAPGECGHEADAPEEMERPVPVAAHEDDGQEIERGTKVPLDPEPRLPVGTRPVVDGHLGHAEPEMVREHRHEAVALTVE